MSTSQPSPLYLLPTELIHRTIHFIGLRPTSRGGWIDSEKMIEIKKNLLALSRIERIGETWPQLAEKQLFKEILIESFEQLKLLANLGSGDRRLNFVGKIIIQQTEYNEGGLFDGTAVPEVINSLSLFLLHLKKLNSLSLEITSRVWGYIKPLLHHIPDISTLRLIVLSSMYDNNHYYSDEDDSPITIADVESLNNLEEIIYSANKPLKDLVPFFGNEIRKTLKVFCSSYSDFSDITSFAQLFPNLEDLAINGTVQDPNLFSSLPPLLKNLKTINSRSPNFVKQFQNLMNQPSSLTHIKVHYNNSSGFSILPCFPATIQEVKLQSFDLTNLAVELESLGDKEIKFGRLVVSLYLYPPKTKEVLEEEGNRIIKQCQRLGVQLDLVFK